MELSFYMADRPEEQALLDLVGCLVVHGARSNGRVLVHRPPESFLPFGGPTDFEQHPVELPELSELSSMCKDDQCRLVTVEVAGAFAYDPFHHARVTFLRVEDEAVGVDNHPVAVWASGDLFSGPAPPGQARAAAEITATFQELVRCLRPSYAAIMVDCLLESPLSIATDLEAGADFRDFFLGADYLGQRALDRVAAAAAGLEVERSELGLFVLSTPRSGDSSDVDYLTAGMAAARAIADRSRARN